MGFKTLFNLNISVLNIAGYLRLLQNFFCNHYMFKIVRKNSTLMNNRSGDTCYIIGLGPSLSNVDLTKIKGDTFVVNDFYKMYERYPEFIPTYYVMVDNLYGTAEKYQLDNAVDIYMQKGTKFILHSRFNKLEINGKDKLFYISPFKGKFTGQEYRIDRVMPSFSNVIGVSIGVAMGMGYKKIVLLGCDFNSFASPVKNHCYKDEDNRRTVELYFELYTYSIVAHGHEMINKYAVKHDIQILNSTRGSLIDAYPMEIEEDLYI